MLQLTVAAVLTMSADVELRIVLVEIAGMLSKQDVKLLAFVYGLENCQDAMKLMDQLTKQQLIINSTDKLQRALKSIGRVDITESVEGLLKCRDNKPTQESLLLEQSMSSLRVGIEEIKGVEESRIKTYLPHYGSPLPTFGAQGPEIHPNWGKSFAHAYTYYTHYRAVGV